MPINLKPNADFWSRIFGDTNPPGDGGAANSSARFDQYNSDLGNRLTTASGDGDLALIDSAAERLTFDPTTNSGGNATVALSFAFINRWLIALVKDVIAKLPASLGSKASSASLSVSTASEVFAQETLTAVGATTARSVVGYKNAIFQYKISNVGTSVTLRVEGSNDSANWFNVHDSDIVKTANITDAFALRNLVPRFLRFNLVSIVGGSPQIDVVLNVSV